MKEERRFIESFSGEYEFLSNFYPCKLREKKHKIIYPSAEHAYQAAKFLSVRKRREIAAIPTAGKAKRAGQGPGMRPNWDYVKRSVMLRIVRAKFRQHPDLARKLKATGNAMLIEGNWWNDTYWGWCQGVGHNYLGKILMQVRDEL